MCGCCDRWVHSQGATVKLLSGARALGALVHVQVLRQVDPHPRGLQICCWAEQLRCETDMGHARRLSMALSSVFACLQRLNRNGHADVG